MKIIIDHADQKHDHDNFSTCTVCGKKFDANDAVHGAFVAHWDCVTDGMREVANAQLAQYQDNAPAV